MNDTFTVDGLIGGFYGLIDVIGCLDGLVVNTDGLDGNMWGLMWKVLWVSMSALLLVLQLDLKDCKEGLEVYDRDITTTVLLKYGLHCQQHLVLLRT